MDTGIGELDKSVKPATETIKTGSKISQQNVVPHTIPESGSETRGSKYSDTEIEQIISDLQGDGFKKNPLRQQYETEVQNLKAVGEKLLQEGKLEEEVARILHQNRRDLGVKYKDVTPQPLRDYIYALNRARYGDELGPTYEYLTQERGKSNMDIINSASRPNSDIDRLLSGFKDWLRRQ